MPPDRRAVFPFNYTLITIQLFFEGIRFLGVVGRKDVVLSAIGPQMITTLGRDLPIQSFHYTNGTVTTEDKNQSMKPSSGLLSHVFLQKADIQIPQEMHVKQVF